MTKNKAIKILVDIRSNYLDMEDEALKDEWSDDELREIEEVIEVCNLSIEALGGKR